MPLLKGRPKRWKWTKIILKSDKLIINIVIFKLCNCVWVLLKSKEEKTRRHYLLTDPRTSYFRGLCKLYIAVGVYKLAVQLRILEVHLSGSFLNNYVNLFCHKFIKWVLIPWKKIDSSCWMQRHGTWSKLWSCDSSRVSVAGDSESAGLCCITLNWKIWRRLQVQPAHQLLTHTLHGLRNLEVQCWIHKGPPKILILIRMTYFFEIHSNIALPYTLRPLL